MQYIGLSKTVTPFAKANRAPFNLVIATLGVNLQVRQAYAARYIDHAETWMKMIADRNLMSHTYDFSRFEQVIEHIANQYLPLLDD